jgi:hypothetical protein
MLRRVVLVVALLAGCRSRATPEQQVRAVIARAADAAEDKDLKTLAGLVSDRFAGPEGMDRAAVVQLLQLQFVRYPAIHVLVRVPSVGFAEPGTAQVTLLAAMASLPLKTPGDLTRAGADIYRFDLILAEESKGQWRVQSATWSPVRPELLFPP